MSDSPSIETHSEVPMKRAPGRESSLDLRPNPWHPIISGCVTLLVFAGIGGGIMWYKHGPVLVPVTGRVTFNSKPLDNAFVMSCPVEGGDYAVSPLDAEGKYNLETKGTRGAYMGEYKLVVKAFTREMFPKPTIPSKYLAEATTPLKILVRKGQPNYFEFEIDNGD